MVFIPFSWVDPGFGVLEVLAGESTPVVLCSTTDGNGPAGYALLRGVHYEIADFDEVPNIHEFYAWDGDVEFPDGVPVDRSWNLEEGFSADSIQNFDDLDAAMAAYNNS